ncbi:MAG: hypothetical protein A3I66_01245 [Burkholderiales bacterium RIFCSPLOWO2_02_FULL_57_36]|nr:MAG: hypothetical protein A3I66_01245 [Burkholderiales bacterium RIFCSPLOWO2_02_FULL_57_36]
MNYRRRPSKLNPYVPLIVGIIATLCAYLVLYFIGGFEYPLFVLNLPLAFFIAGGISTIVLLVWRDRQR